MGAPRFVLNRFWPSNLFLGGIPGAWYDPTDLSTMFQDSTGTTPVTAVEQPVGLILDKSQGLVLGPELVTNGDFSGGITGWIAGNASWSVGGGKASNDGTNVVFASFRQNNVVTAGTFYLVEWDQVTTAGDLRLWFNGVQLIALSVSGTGRKSYRVQCTSTGSLFFEASVGAVLSIDNVTVKALPGNHASQSTAASRPTYRARYNLLTYSEQFSNAVWTKGNVTVVASAGVAPDGTNTASLVYPSSSGTSRTIYEAGPGTTAASTTSFYVKASGKSWVWVVAAIGSSTTGAYFNVSTGTKGFEFPGYTGTISSVGNGWYRVSVSSPSAAMNYAQIIITDADASNAVTANGTDGVLLWGAQLLTAADVTATGNAYQRIAAATVYDTAPIFRPYLAFDGVDDSLATAAINFTSTDKMTVFAGATKSSDAARGMLAELSVGGGAGSFNISAPAGASATYSCSNGGTVFVGPLLTAATFAAPATDVLTFTGNISAPSITLSVDRVSAINDASAQGVGTYGTYPLFIGRRNNASLPFNGRLYSLIVRGAASSTTEIIDTETWVNQRTGAF